jgi:hypothetical protein
MDPFGQLQQGPAGPAPPIENQCLLRGERSLSAGVVLRDHRSGAQAERPLDLPTTMVEAPIVPIQEKRDVLGGNPLLAPEQSESAARVPKPDQIGRGDEENLVGKS